MLIDVRNVCKTFLTPAGPFAALSDVSLTIDRGEFIAVLGQSGSGKSTLLNLLGGIDRASGGEIEIGGTPVHTLSERDLSAWRGRSVGVVFQFFQLLPTLTVCENVMLPMDFCRSWPARDRRRRACALLERLDVLEQADKFPSALSGGQQQRVAVARALANDPLLLLADEPTGNLDSATSIMLLDVLKGLQREGRTIVMVTHDAAARAYATRSITLHDGVIVEAREPREEREQVHA